MYEDETAINIENRMLDRIDGTVYDKRTGQIIQTTLAATAIELAKLYQELNFIDEQHSPDTADRSHLEAWCRTFSITPLQATYAIHKARIVMAEGFECPIGSRFSQDSDLNFTVISKNDAENEYSVQCETAGEIGNTAYGRIIPILNIPGLISASIIGLEIPGTDIESDESLRERFKANFQDKSYGWNLATYKQEVSKIQGVGGCKFLRHFEEKDWWVGVYIIDTTYRKASEELINLVQETLLPILPDYSEPVINNSGEGEVAIGHVPKVMTVDEIPVNITLHLDLDSTTRYGEIENTIKEKITGYLDSLNKRWDEQEYLTVRVSGIESAILDIKGVEDIYDTLINGERANLQLGSYEIAVLGELTKDDNNSFRTVKNVG